MGLHQLWVAVKGSSTSMTPYTIPGMMIQSKSPDSNLDAVCVLWPKLPIQGIMQGVYGILFITGLLGCI